jgi:hypothetical protein
MSENPQTLSRAALEHVRKLAQEHVLAGRGIMPNFLGLIGRNDRHRRHRTGARRQLCLKPSRLFDWRCRG